MRLIGALAIVMGLVTGASAEDWSQFIDNSPQKPVATRPAPTTTAAAAPKARPAAKSVATKPKSKAARPARARHK
jgi:hypothetical protein